MHARRNFCSAELLNSWLMEMKFDKQPKKLANDIIMWAKQPETLDFGQHNIDINILQIVSFPDHGFANDEDRETQLE